MKKSISVLSALLLTTLLSAQVKFNLNYDPNSKVYTVSLVPEASWNAPLNMVSAAQVVLRVDADKTFVPGITSLVEGLIWADNAYIESPDAAPGYTFVCISLVNGPTNKIKLDADQEVPLFSFINAGNDCAGKVALLPNNDPMTQAVRALGFNITQYFPVLGARGNAFSGFANSEVDCSPASGTIENFNVISEVLISPVPADRGVKVEWNQESEMHGLQQIVICDAKGVEVYREKISTGKGPHTLELNVENWQAGLYRLRFSFENNRQSKSWNLMVIH
jgi:hypothetical protein